MANPPTIRIFFSSPGDVKMERETARRIVERLQAELGERALLEPYFWEHEVMLATRDYQQNIRPLDEFEIVVCILWSRLGTPLNPERYPRPGGGSFGSGTEYEFFMAMEAHRERNTPDVLVYRNRTEPRRPSRPKEDREKFDTEVDRLDHFIDTYFREGTEYKVAVNSYATLGDFEERLTKGLRELIERRAPATGPRPRRVATYQGRPYLGLAAFDFADAPVFFGRTAQVGEVIGAFQVQELDVRANEGRGRHFVLVLGASGSGKSSLARAGVLPMLVQPGVIEGAPAWRRALFKPGAAGGDVFLALASALLEPEALPELGSDGTSAKALAGMLRDEPRGAGMLLVQALKQAGAAARVAEEHSLRDQLRKYQGEGREHDAAEKQARLERLEAPLVRLALLVDQLEELFTADQTAESTTAFVECLDVLARSGRVFVLGTLRSDYYPSCLKHPRLVELMRDTGTYALPAPGLAELGQMIRQPAAAAGLLFEEHTTSGEKLDELLRDAALRDPSALPLLGYTLEQLYERRTPEGLLTLAAYRALGGLEGAIGSRAEEVYAALPAEAQAAFDPVWRQLVALGERGTAVRRRAEQGVLAGNPGAVALVDALVAARLLSADAQAGGSRSVSIAHEALFEHWPRLRQWIADNREFLRTRSRLAARLAEWVEQQQDRHCLIHPGPLLVAAEKLLAQHAAALEPAEAEFIRASTARALALQQRDRRITWAAVLLSVLALAGGVYAWREQGVARASQARTAYLLGIRMLENGNTREGLTSLAQTLKLDPKHAGARDRLYSYHVYGPPKALCLRSTAGPESVRQRISTGQRVGVQRMACLDSRGAPEVVDLTTLQALRGGWSDNRGLSSATLNRTGSHLLCRERGQRCFVWSVDDRRPSGPIQLDPASDPVACTDDGSLLVEGSLEIDAAGKQRGRVRVWDVGSGKVRYEWLHSGPIACIEVDSAHGLIATAGAEGVLFDLATGSERARFAEADWSIQAIRFAEAGDVAVVEASSQKGPGYRFVFVDARSGAPWPGSREVTSPSVLDFALSREGIALAVAAFSDQVAIQYRDEGQPERFIPLPAYPTSVRFSPDDSQLLTASSDGAVRIFDAATLEPVFAPVFHDGRLESLLMSWDSRYLLTSTSRHASVWDLAVARALPLPMAQSGQAFACGFEPSGTSFWTASGDSGVQAWDARALEPRGQALAFRPVGAAVLDDECARAVVELGGDTIQALDLVRGAAAGSPWRLPQSHSNAAISRDCTRLALALGDGVSCFEAESGKLVGRSWTTDGPPGVLCLCRDGRHCAAILGQGRRVLLHDTSTGAETELATAGAECVALQFSPDDHWLAAAETGTGTRTARVLLWDLRDPRAQPRQLGHNEDLLDMQFSPDSRWLATGTLGRIVQVWDASTGSLASNPMVHAGGGVRGVLFSPDSQRLAVGYDDRTVRLYDWHEACAVSEALGQPGELRQMSFSPDGTRLLTFCVGDTKSLATVWEVAPSTCSSVELVSLTEASTALQDSGSGLMRTCDPIESLKRVRKLTPGSWFFQSPARRPVSPGFTALNLRWIVDDPSTIEQAYYAMPAVSMVRAALGYIRQRQLNELRQHVQETETGKPTSEEASQLQMLELAVPSLTRSAARRAHGDAITSLWLGLQLASAGDPPAARPYLDDALRLSRDDRELLERASELFRGANDGDSERRALQRLCELEPAVVRHRCQLGYNHWRCGERAAAQAEFSPIVDDLSLEADDRAQILICLGRYADALALWKDAADRQKLAQGAYSPSALLTLAVANQLAGQVETAVTFYHDLIAREPSAANPASIAAATPYPELRDALNQVLQATVARYPEFAPK